MNKTVYECYSSDGDMTFIMEDIWDNDELVSTEVKGFYFGEPNEKCTEIFYGKLKAVCE